MNRKECMKRAKRIVVKVGTSSITSASGRIDSEKLRSVVTQVAGLSARGLEVLLVTSGSIAAGVEGLGLKERPKSIPELQAAASVGQGLLLAEYTRFFGDADIKVGQVLITQFDITHRQQYLNARNTLDRLLSFGVLPVINENDTTAVDEIKFGDNDTLAALVTTLVQADLLIMLTVTEGLLTPSEDGSTEVVSEVGQISGEIEALAGDATTKFGSGGMATKISAAKIATFGQAAAVIAGGSRESVLSEIVDGREVGTFFRPRKKSVSGRKLWIAFGRVASGTVIVDDGAKQALVAKGKSLLPAGVVGTKGRFQPGDAVHIVDSEGAVFAKGLANFSSGELDQIKGMKSSDVSNVLTEDAEDEVVHRDCLLVLE